MIITTARKPSSKIRIFCKHLGRFTGWKYVSRGKTGLSSLTDGTFLIVGEHKGNPGSFKFFSKGRCVLSIHANVSLDNDIGPGEAPVIDGESPLAIALGKATGLGMGKTSERFILVNDRIEFIEKGVPYIIMTVLAVRGDGIV